MHRFWSRYIKPIVETVAPRRILEVGAEFGWNTEHLLEYCRRTGAHIDVVDPAPHSALHQVLARYGAEYTYHPVKSLDAIARLTPWDLVLLDGDHNWFTVYNELKLLFVRSAKAGEPPPIVIFHDVAWPYARRDMYYDPAGIKIADRHPYAFRGMIPGQPELVDTGLNGHFANALQEGGPRNGVLTAIEDFKASIGVPMSLFQLPFFNGLGILIPEPRMTAALRTVIDEFFSPASLLETCVVLERDGMTVRADLAAHKIKLTQRTEALSRARARIAELQSEVEKLRLEASRPRK